MKGSREPDGSKSLPIHISMYLLKYRKNEQQESHQERTTNHYPKLNYSIRFFNIPRRPYWVLISLWKQANMNRLWRIITSCYIYIFSRCIYGHDRLARTIFELDVSQTRLSWKIDYLCISHNVWYVYLYTYFRLPKSSLQIK